MNEKKNINKNRIVRIRSNQIHEAVESVSELTDISYQAAFEIVAQALLNEYQIGDELIINLCLYIERRKSGE